MQSFDDAFEDSSFAFGAKPCIEAGWNMALSTLKAALDNAENLGDVKDTIQFMRTDT